jgi:hypothetical protein
MKKILILLFAVAALAGCVTDPDELGRIHKWEGFPPDSRSLWPWDFWSSEMFETLTGIPAETVKTSERVLIERGRYIDTFSLMRITGVNVTYVLIVWTLIVHPQRVSITLVIDGRAVTLKTATRESHESYEWVMAAVPPDYVEGLFASDDIRIQCWTDWRGWANTVTIKLTAEEISYLRMLSPQKPQ